MRSCTQVERQLIGDENPDSRLSGRGDNLSGADEGFDDPDIVRPRAQVESTKRG